MDLECAICCGLLAEEPDIQGPPLPPKRRRHSTEPIAGPSSDPVAPGTPDICVPKCGHMFHKRCLLNWIQSSNTKSCPSCRKALTKRQLTTVFLPAVNQEEKKCDKCEITEKKCEEVTGEKEKLKKLYEKEEERRKGVEMETRRSLKVTNNKLCQVVKDREEIKLKFLEEGKKVVQLNAEKGELKKLFEEEVERRKGVEEVNDKKVNQLGKEKQKILGRLLEKEVEIGRLTTEKEKWEKWFEEEVDRRISVEVEAKKKKDASNKRISQLLKGQREKYGKMLELVEQLEQVTAEREQVKKLLEEEKVRGNEVEVKAKKKEEVKGRRIKKLVKEKAELDEQLEKKGRKVERLEEKVEEVNRREREVNTRLVDLQGQHMDIQGKFMEEKDKVEEVQGRLDELEERHRLLIGDIEEMTRKYKDEQEKANILEGRVASLEATLDSSDLDVNS